MNKTRAIRHVNRRAAWIHFKNEVRPYSGILFVTACMLGALLCKALGEGIDSFFYQVARWIVLTFTI